MGVGVLESVQEEEGSREDLRRCVFHMRERQKNQAKLLLLRKHRIHEQTRKISLLEKRQHNYLNTIQSQLLIFESNLKRAQKEFDTVVRNKDDTIRQQHQLICALSLALVKRGGHEDLKNILPGIQISASNLDDAVPKKENNQDSLKRLGKKDVQIISSSKDHDSLNDSDSAIMMEDAYDSLIVIPVGKGEAKVMRSVSDALEIVSRSTSLTHTKGIAPITNVPKRIGHGSLSSSPSCSSEDSDESPPSTMTKPPSDILRTAPDGQEALLGEPLTSSLKGLSPPLHSSPTRAISSRSPSPSITPLASPTPSQRLLLPDDPCNDLSKSTGSSHDSSYDSDATLSDGSSEDEEIITPLPNSGGVSSTDKKHLKGSYEKLNSLSLSFYKKKPAEELIQVTYNRVMSNHRSVTKPKDVKYKRINKAKSRSLEELRGKLKFYENKQSISLDLGHSEA